jgi:ribosomal protein L40E
MAAPERSPGTIDTVRFAFSFCRRCGANRGGRAKNGRELVHKIKGRTPVYADELVVPVGGPYRDPECLRLVEIDVDSDRSVVSARSIAGSGTRVFR